MADRLYTLIIYIVIKERYPDNILHTVCKCISRMQRLPGRQCQIRAVRTNRNNMVVRVEVRRPRIQEQIWSDGDYQENRRDQRRGNCWPPSWLNCSMKIRKLCRHVFNIGTNMKSVYRRSFRLVTMMMTLVRTMLLKTAATFKACPLVLPMTKTLHVYSKRDSFGFASISECCHVFLIQ